MKAIGIIKRYVPLTSVWIAITLLFPLISFALDDSEYSGYDSIIRELTTNQTERTKLVTPQDSFSKIQFHGGLSILSTRLSVDLPAGYTNAKSLNGIEAQLGIDLFSPQWQAIGSVRTFNPEKTNGAELSLREFDLLLLHRIFSSKRSLEFNIGGGMAARYLDVGGAVPSGVSTSYTTPSTVFMTGAGIYITPALSLGLAVSYRSPLIKDTIDEGSIDGGFQVGGHF